MGAMFWLFMGFWALGWVILAVILFKSKQKDAGTTK